MAKSLKDFSDDYSNAEFTYRSTPPQRYNKIADLRHFGKLSDGGKRDVLLGKTDFSLCGFDIEATHLKGNIGRILCCSFKPLGGEVYTFSALDRRFRKADVYDDSRLAVAIRDELEKYSIIFGHNSRLFDTKYVNARLIRAGQRLKKPSWHPDTMWAWRSKMAAWSGLDSIQKFILPSDEGKSPIEWPAWMRALGWSKALREEAMSTIIEHCERDVSVLEKVFIALVEAGAVRSLRQDGGIY